MDDFDQTQAIFLDDVEEENDATDELNPDEEKKPVGTLKVLLQKGLNETSYPLYEGDNIIGRGEETCHVCIPSKSLSKEHACIQIIGDSHLIYDKSSRNKTRRGKLFLTPEVRYELKASDEILFADVKCVYTKLDKESKDDAASDTEGSESFLLQAESTLEITTEDRKEENNNTNASFGTDDDDDILVQATQPFTKDLDQMPPDLVIQESPIVKGSASDGDIKTLVLSESDSEGEEMGETPKRRKKDIDKSAVEETQFFEDSDTDPEASLDLGKFGQATQAQHVVTDTNKDSSALFGAATQAYGDFEDGTCSDDEKKINDSNDATQSFINEDTNDTTTKKTPAKTDGDNELLETQSFDEDGKTNSDGTQSFVTTEKGSDAVKKNGVTDVKGTQVFEEENSDDDFNDMFVMNTLAPAVDSEEEIYEEDEGENEDKNQPSKMDDATQLFDAVSAKDVEGDQTAVVEPNTVAISEEVLKDKSVKKKNASTAAKHDKAPVSEEDLPTQVFDGTLPVEQVKGTRQMGKPDEEAATQVFEEEPDLMTGDDGSEAATQVFDAESDSTTRDVGKEAATQVFDATQDLPTQVFDATVAVAETIAVPDTLAVDDSKDTVQSDVVSDTLAISEPELNKDGTGRKSPKHKKGIVKKRNKANVDGENSDEDNEENQCLVKGQEEIATQAYGMDPDMETQAYGMDTDTDEDETGGDKDKGKVTTQAYAMGVGEEDATQAVSGIEETQSFDFNDVVAKNIQGQKGQGKESDNKPETCVFTDDEDDSDMEDMSILRPKEEDGQTQVFEMEIEESKTIAAEPTQAYNLDAEEDTEELETTKNSLSEKAEDITTKGMKRVESSELEGKASASSSGLSVEVPPQDTDFNPWVGESQHSPELADIGKGSKFVSCLDALPDSLDDESSLDGDLRPPLIPLPSRSPLKSALVQGRKSRSPSPSPKRVAFVEEAKADKASRRKTTAIVPQSTPTTSGGKDNSKPLGRRRTTGGAKPEGSGDKKAANLSLLQASNTDEENEDDDIVPAKGKGGKGGKTKGKASSPAKKVVVAVEESVTRSSSGRRISRSSLLTGYDTSDVVSKRGKKGKAESKKAKPKEEEKLPDVESEKRTEDSSSKSKDVDEEGSLSLSSDVLKGNGEEKDETISGGKKEEEVLEEKEAGAESKGKGRRRGAQSKQPADLAEPGSSTSCEKTTSDSEEPRASTRGGRQKCSKEKNKDVSPKVDEKTETTSKVEDDTRATPQVEEKKETQKAPVAQSKSRKRKGGRQTACVDDEEVKEDSEKTKEENGGEESGKVETVAEEVAKKARLVNDRDDSDSPKEKLEGEGNVEEEKANETDTRSARRKGGATEGVKTKRGRKGKQTEMVETKDSREGKKVEECVEDKKEAKKGKHEGESSKGELKISARMTRKRVTKEDDIESQNEGSENKQEEVVDDTVQNKTLKRRGRKEAVEEVREAESVSGKDKEEEVVDDTAQNKILKRRGRKGVVEEVNEAESFSGKEREEESAIPDAEEKVETHQETGPSSSSRRGRRTTQNQSQDVKTKEQKIPEVSPSTENLETDKPVTSSRQRRGGRTSVLPVDKKPETKKSELVESGQEEKEEAPRGRGRSKKGAEASSSSKDKSPSLSDPTEVKVVQRAGRQSVKGSKKATAVSEEETDVFQKPAEVSSAPPVPPPPQSPKRGRGRKRGSEDIDKIDESDSVDSGTQETPKKRLDTEGLSGSQQRKRIKAIDSQEASQESSSSSAKKAKPSTPSTPRTPSQRGSMASSQPLSSPSLRKSTTDHKPRVMFTGVIDQKGEKILKDLGGDLATNIQQCSHLVTDKIRRTVKFLGGLARGLPIVTPHWLENCKTAGTFLDGNPFLVSDAAMEKQFSFNLHASITKAQTNGPIFHGYHIHVTKSVKPDPTQMKDILNCAGAEFLPKMPSKAGENTVVVSCPEDEKLCKPALAASIPVLGAEFLLTGILRQEVDLDSYSLFTKPTPAAPKGRAKKR